MNVQYVQARSDETPRSGHARHAGQCFISLASRNGPLMKVQRWLNNEIRMGNLRPRDSGGVQDAIYQKTFFPQHIPVGVKKNWTRDRFPVCHRTPAARLVASNESCPKSARILANCYVMRVLVHHVCTLGLTRAVFAVRNQCLGDALIRTTMLGGAVVKYAEI